MTDRGFCSPLVDPEAERAKEAQRKKAELDREIEKVTQEYEEKQKKKKEKRKAKEESKDKDKGKADDQTEEDNQKLEKEKKEKVSDATTVLIVHVLDTVPDSAAGEKRLHGSQERGYSSHLCPAKVGPHHGHAPQRYSRYHHWTRLTRDHRQVHQMRIDRLRNLEAAKNNRERLRQMTFPSVPKGDLP